MVNSVADHVYQEISDTIYHITLNFRLLSFRTDIEQVKNEKKSFTFR